ncbi:hypothetical protein SUGI_0681430 [Cryptomeria japonica]|uniref:aspartyl protease family protein 2-like n=1 Tax=Cryptomeria japonica TaxID=3369 RepID=UPI0024146BB8|nr:aspartyl protease family protein 2-like [Cryptomeria japonica]GLJ33877.1 hypothetical protein SUGI_0681430 [Cryptomeria japonica]
MAMNKQALLFALSFLLYCFLRPPSCECTTTEEKYYIVGVNTFLIEEGRDLNAPTRSPSECNPCKDCSSNAKFPMYVPKQSSSYRSVSCKLSKCPPLGSDAKDFESKCDNWDTCTYRDTNGLAQGSEGDYITETLQVGDNTLNELHMGCAYSFTPRRDYATSGHLGLGSLSLGKYSIPSSVKIFTPMQNEPQFASSAYLLGLEGISVGWQRLSMNMQVPGALPTITFIDTAIMATQLVKTVYDALRSSFEEKMKTYAPAIQPASPFGEFKPCYQLSNITSVKFPTFTLHFKGNGNFDVLAVGSLLQVANDVVCFPFQQSPNDAVNIIGNVQQQGITVAYDNVNNRIGFGPGSCCCNVILTITF